MANIYNAAIQRVGRVEADGTVYDLHADPVGFVTQDGHVFNSSSQAMGAIDAQGRLFDAAGQPVGEVGPDGAIFNWQGRYMGYLATEAGMPLGLRGGVALLLLPLLP